MWIREPGGEVLGALRAGDTTVRQGSPRGSSHKDRNCHLEHPPPLPAGLLSDRPGACLHTGARLIPTQKERFTNSVTSLDSVTSRGQSIGNSIKCLWQKKDLGYFSGLHNRG